MILNYVCLRDFKSVLSAFLNHKHPCVACGNMCRRWGRDTQDIPKA